MLSVSECGGRNNAPPKKIPLNPLNPYVLLLWLGYDLSVSPEGWDLGPPGNVLSW